MLAWCFNDIQPWETQLKNAIRFPQVLEVTKRLRVTSNMWQLRSVVLLFGLNDGSLAHAICELAKGLSSSNWRIYSWTHTGRHPLNLFGFINLNDNIRLTDSPIRSFLGLEENMMKFLLTGNQAANIGSKNSTGIATYGVGPIYLMLLTSWVSTTKTKHKLAKQLTGTDATT